MKYEFYESFFFLFKKYTQLFVNSCNDKFCLSNNYTSYNFAAITSELRGKWQENRRSSISKEDINAIRWEQLKHMLQSGKQKVENNLRNINLLFMIQKTENFVLKTYPSTSGMMNRRKLRYLRHLFPLRHPQGVGSLQFQLFGLRHCPPHKRPIVLLSTSLSLERGALPHESIGSLFIHLNA